MKLRYVHEEGGAFVQIWTENAEFAVLDSHLNARGGSSPPHLGRTEL